MPHKANVIEDKLINKFGFTRSSHKGNDHFRYEIKIPGLPVIQTHFSHGAKQSDKLQGLIAKQIRVKPPFLDGMIVCRNSRDAYIQQVETNPYPPFEQYLTRNTK